LPNPLPFSKFFVVEHLVRLRKNIEKVETMTPQTSSIFTETKVARLHTEGKILRSHAVRLFEQSGLEGIDLLIDLGDQKYYLLEDVQEAIEMLA
tara:strand:- start:589 stop:870 length:282 start_codon:yes stop_codon:yes gene_type:complete